MNVQHKRLTRTTDVMAKFREGQRRGLVAGGNVIRNEVRRALRGGYRSSLQNFAADVMAAEFESGRTKVPKYIQVKVGKSFRPIGGGAFVTGKSVNHVTLSEPVAANDGAYVTIGTDLLYNLFWEVGHHNIFTRNYERDEKWGPAFRASRVAAIAAFQRVQRQTMAQASVSVKE